jgi:uncharacterized membrane protein
MSDLGRLRTPSLVLVLLAGGILALAWWDCIYPNQVVAWWNGEPVYHFYVRRLAWALVLAEGLCLGLWLLSAVASPGRDEGPLYAALPFSLALLASLCFARYTFHPLGIQPGSSVWTYGLVAITAGVLAFPLSRLLRALGAPALLRRWGWAIVCLAAVLYALVFGFLSVARHTSFHSHALDLGTMDQAAWNTIHGRILERTPLYRPPAEGARYENRLLDAKLELIFIPLSALYWLWPDPRVLLIVQTLFLALGALPLYRLVYEQASRGGSASGAAGARGAFLATLLASGYLLYLPLHYVNMADFHPSALMIPFLLAAWWAMTRGRWRWYYAGLVLALCCRIEAAFVVLALGAVVAASNKGHRRHGLYTMGLGAAWLALNFGVVVPLVRQAYGPGAGDLVARRFGALGSDAASVVRTALAHPRLVITTLASREKLQTLFDLFSPLGFLPLLNPPAILPALPVLVINLLADSPWQNSVHAHYMAPVLPFAWIAAGGLVAWLSRSKRWPEGSAVLATFVLVNTGLVSLLFSPFPPGKAFRLADFYQPSSHQEDLRAVIDLIPARASLCAQSDIYPHVSQRQDACLFDRCQLQGDEKAEYVILDLDATSNKSPLGYHPFYEVVDAWLDQGEYGVIAQRGGVLLLQQGAPRENMPAVRAALDQYGRDFYRVRFVQTRTPLAMDAKDVYRIPITLQNTGSQGWHSQDQLPVRLAYRWWTSDGTLLAVDALRTDLPHQVKPGQQVRMRAWLLTPAEPGKYTLEWDLVREGDAWFGDMGAAMLRQEVTIR